MAIEMIEDGTQIKVIGVGGGGGNAVNHMIACNVQGVDYICANTDAQALSHTKAGTIIQLSDSGLGAGGKPEKGREAAEAAADEIRQALRGAHMVFITAGMGGGTGTGAAPVVARIAKDMGVLTVAVVTKPFGWEGSRRMNYAEAGLEELEANVDSLVVVLNQKLREVLDPDITQAEAFAQVDNVLRNAVGGIAEVINGYGQVNVDFEDVRTVMSEPGRAMMGTATASGPDRARIAAEQAIACPLLEGIDLSSVRGVLVLVTAASGSLKMRESEEATNIVSAYAAPDAHIIYGASYDDGMGDDLRVTVVATGLSRIQQQRQSLSVVQGGLRTGTDNLTLNDTSAQSAASGGTYTTPRVWSGRGDRSSASGRMGGLSAGGMDEVDIPAFLRRQAD